MKENGMPPCRVRAGREPVALAALFLFDSSGLGDNIGGTFLTGILLAQPAHLKEG